MQLKKQDQQRPLPPDCSLGWESFFAPAPDVSNWIFENILSESGPLYNPDHEHLNQAKIGFLWTNVENSKKGRRVVGQAELPNFNCGKWQKARQIYQLEQWFGFIPDFIITLDTSYCRLASDLEFCALVEHELYHCAHALNEFGLPRFNKETGDPIFALRGHDVEEFIGVVRRYGIGQQDGLLAQLVQVANSAPEIEKSNIANACGNCAANI